MVEPIRINLDVAVPPERAFELFSARLDTWWPREYTWSQDVLQEIGIEPDAGGMCFERGPHGFRCSRHGEGAAAYRDGLASPQGWPCILEQFRAAVS